MPLPDIDAIIAVLKKYQDRLKLQSLAKKNATNIFNYFRANLPIISNYYNKNDYITMPLHEAKNNKINHYISEYEIAKKLSPEKAIKFWLNHLDILRGEIKSLREAEIFHESKYGFAVHVVCQIICRALQHEPAFVAIKQKLKTDLLILETEIENSKQAGHLPRQEALKKRDQILLELVNLGDFNATLKASKLDILTESKPDAIAFTIPTPYNAPVSSYPEIHPDIPWAYQYNLHILYEYRLEKLRFPPSLHAWDEWKATKNNLECFKPMLDSDEKTTNSTMSILQELPIKTFNASISYEGATDSIATPDLKSNFVTPEGKSINLSPNLCTNSTTPKRKK